MCMNNLTTAITW